MPEGRLLPRSLYLALSATLLLLTTLVACVRSSIEVPGAFADVQAAWRAGCRSGYGAAGRKGYPERFYRNATLYEEDQRYKAAWDDAYQQCVQYKPRYRRIPIAGGKGGHAGVGAGH